MYESKKQSKDEVKKKAGKPFLNSIYFVLFKPARVGRVVVGQSALDPNLN